MARETHPATTRALIADGLDVARIEGVGPIDIAQLHEVLGNAAVT